MHQLEDGPKCLISSLTYSKSSTQVWWLASLHLPQNTTLCFIQIWGWIENDPVHQLPSLLHSIWSHFNFHIDQWNMAYCWVSFTAYCPHLFQLAALKSSGHFLKKTVVDDSSHHNLNNYVWITYWPIFNNCSVVTLSIKTLCHKKHKMT